LNELLWRLGTFDLAYDIPAKQLERRSGAQVHLCLSASLDTDHATKTYLGGRPRPHWDPLFIRQQTPNIVCASLERCLDFDGSHIVDL
jgi:hypothetical protein